MAPSAGTGVQSQYGLHDVFQFRRNRGRARGGEIRAPLMMEVCEFHVKRPRDAFRWPGKQNRAAMSSLLHHFEMVRFRECTYTRDVACAGTMALREFLMRQVLSSHGRQQTSSWVEIGNLILRPQNYGHFHPRRRIVPVGWPRTLQWRMFPAFQRYAMPGLQDWLVAFHSDLKIFPARSFLLEQFFKLRNA